MKLRDLAAQTEVSAATIKFWIREGLLPRAPLKNERTAIYGPEHVERLLLIRTLREEFDAPLRRIRELTSLIDRQAPMLEVLELCQSLASSPWLPPASDAPAEPGVTEAVDALISSAGWTPLPSIARGELERTLANLERQGFGFSAEALLAYAAALQPFAQADLDFVSMGGSPDAVARRTLLGTRAQVSVLVAVNQLAHTSAALAAGPPREP